MHHKWCDHTTEECKVVQAQMKKVPPHQKFGRKPTPRDLLNVELLKNKEFFSMIKDNVEKSCSKMFKAFKKEISEDFNLIEEGKRKADALDENQAYDKLMMAPLHEAPDNELLAVTNENNKYKNWCSPLEDFFTITSESSKD